MKAQLFVKLSHRISNFSINARKITNYYRFFMVAPTIQQERVMTWMKKWAEKMNANVHAVVRFLFIASNLFVVFQF